MLQKANVTKVSRLSQSEKHSALERGASSGSMELHAAHVSNYHMSLDSSDCSFDYFMEARREKVRAGEGDFFEGSREWARAEYA